jgi:hypothetical protein
MRTMPTTLKRMTRMTSGCSRFSCMRRRRFSEAPQATMRSEIRRVIVYSVTEIQEALVQPHGLGSFTGLEK